MEERVQPAQDAMQAAATGADLGDLFEYKHNTPVTILKNQSAMVPIVNGGVGAEKVSIWSAEAGSTRPLRAVWLTNSTGQTLDGGSMSIVEGQAFAGKGLIDPLKAGERRLVSYATDLAMQVTSTGDTSPSRITLGKVCSTIWNRTNSAAVPKTTAPSRPVAMPRPTPVPTPRG